jgi:ribosome-associated protein
VDREALRASIEASVEMDFSRSGGPGGQNVNKVNSKVSARVLLSSLEGLSEAEAARVRLLLATRITLAGELLVVANEERDQVRNREIALDRLFSLISEAALIPKRRRKTKPGRGARERRLSSKKAHGEAKRLRGKPGDNS